MQAALVDKMAGKILNDDQRGVVLQVMMGTDRVAGVQGRAANPGRVAGLANDVLPRSQKSTRQQRPSSRKYAQARSAFAREFPSRAIAYLQSARAAFLADHIAHNQPEYAWQLQKNPLSSRRNLSPPNPRRSWQPRPLAR